MDESAHFQFLDQQASHDGLAGAGIIGEEKTDARQFEEVIVHRF